MGEGVTMRKANVFFNNVPAGVLEEIAHNRYRFIYHTDYTGQPISLTMPLTQKIYEYDAFPSFFEGLLPEGGMLEVLLRKYKINKKDYFGQLLQVGQDMVGAVTVNPIS